MSCPTAMIEEQQGGDRMSCKRCGGFMVVEPVWHLKKEESRNGIDTARCLNCGNLEDDVIYANRAISRMPNHCERSTAEVRSPRAIRPIRLERHMQTEGGIVEYPRDTAPRPPQEPPSTEPRMPEFARIAPHNPIIESQRQCA